MAKTRTPIGKPLERKLLYEAARTCCVCRVPRKPVEIHHIDQDPSNNIESNLVVICRNCHDEAHTKHTMSKNLSVDHLKHAKEKWLGEVAERASFAMLPGSNLAQAMWTYVNHEKLPRLLKQKGVNFEDWLYKYLRSIEAIDPDGVPIFQEPMPKSGRLVTIYDRFEWDTSQRLHHMYMGAVDQLILETNPVELGAIWTKPEIRDLVKPGTFCYAIRGFRFRVGETINREESRLVYARAKGIEIRLHANTRHMYGSSALYTNFCGSNFSAVFMVAKDVATEGNLLVVNATPLAMGAGFVPSEYHSPYQLKYGWAAA